MNSNGTESGGTSSGGVQSVDRAVTVLEILAQRGEAGVSEVAEAIDVHKSTAFRLLGALEAHGMVEQEGERGKNRLAFASCALPAPAPGAWPARSPGASTSPSTAAGSASASPTNWARR